MIPILMTFWQMQPLDNVCMSRVVETYWRTRHKPIYFAFKLRILHSKRSLHKLNNNNLLHPEWYSYMLGRRYYTCLFTLDCVWVLLPITIFVRFHRAIMPITSCSIESLRSSCRMRKTLWWFCRSCRWSGVRKRWKLWRMFGLLNWWWTRNLISLDSAATV